MWGTLLLSSDLHFLSNRWKWTLLQMPLGRWSAGSIHLSTSSSGGQNLRHNFSESSAQMVQGVRWAAQPSGRSCFRDDSGYELNPAPCSCEAHTPLFLLGFQLWLMPVWWAICIPRPVIPLHLPSLSVIGQVHLIYISPASLVPDLQIHI